MAAATPATPGNPDDKIYYRHPVSGETFVRAKKISADPTQQRGGLVAPPLVCCRKPMPEGGVIEVTVEDPYLKNDHYKYRVFLKTNLPEYGYPRLMVKKRYNNFKDLAKRLSYLDSTLPSIPKADFFGRYSKKILNERTQGFRTFLNRVMSLPTLNRCPIMMDFFMQDWTKAMNPDEVVIKTADLHQQAMSNLPSSPTLSPSSPPLSPTSSSPASPPIIPSSTSSPNVLAGKHQPYGQQQQRSNTFSRLPGSPQSQPVLSPPNKALPPPPPSSNRPLSPSPLPPSAGSPNQGSPVRYPGSPQVGGYPSPLQLHQQQQQQQQQQQLGSPLVSGYSSPKQQQQLNSPQMGYPGSPQVAGYPSPQQLQQQQPQGYGPQGGAPGGYPQVGGGYGPPQGGVGGYPSMGGAGGYPQVGGGYGPPQGGVGGYPQAGGMQQQQQPQQLQQPQQQPPPQQQQPQPPRGPPRRPAKAKAKGLYDFDAEDETELSFKEGDIITILSKPNDEWWEGLLSTETTSKTGLIPVAYVQEL